MKRESVLVQVKVHPSMKARWEAAAGRNLSRWIRQACLYALENPEAVKAHTKAKNEAFKAQWSHIAAQV